MEQRSRKIMEDDGGGGRRIMEGYWGEGRGRLWRIMGDNGGGRLEIIENYGEGGLRIVGISDYGWLWNRGGRLRKAMGEEG